MEHSERQVRLIPINIKDEQDLNWLHSFIVDNYPVPKFMLPTKEDLQSPRNRYFRAFAELPPSKKSQEPIGITGYEIRTPYLAETQKTIVAKEYRGGGWGKAISFAIEDEVQKAGFYKIRTCIYQNNLAMIQIKLKQGYIIEGYHRDHDGPGLNEYSLGKILAKRRSSDF